MFRHLLVDDWPAFASWKEPKKSGFFTLSRATMVNLMRLFVMRIALFDADELRRIARRSRKTPPSTDGPDSLQGTEFSLLRRSALANIAPETRKRWALSLIHI